MTSIYIRSFIVLCAIVAGAVACKGEQTGQGPGSPADFSHRIEEGKVLAKADDIEIHQGYLEAIARINPQLKAQVETPLGRKKLIDTLIEQELLFRASGKAGLQNDPEVLEKQALYARVIVSQAFVEKELDKRIADYYDEHKKDEFERVHVAHIYLKTEAKKDKKAGKDAEKSAARAESAVELKKKAMDTLHDVQNQLQQGADFAALAEQYSEDVLTKKKGGDLGFVSKSDKRLERKEWQPLSDKAFSMKTGEISDIIESKNGLHIVKALSNPELAPLTEVENRIRLKVAGSIKKDVLGDLKKDFEIIYLDEEIKAKEAEEAELKKGKKSAAPQPKAETKKPHIQIPKAHIKEVPSASPAEEPAKSAATTAGEKKS